jgi:hypothetical protein
MSNSSTCLCILFTDLAHEQMSADPKWDPHIDIEGNFGLDLRYMTSAG